MNKLSRITLSVLVLLVLVTMTGCFNNKASQPGVIWNPLSWGDQTAEQTATEILAAAQAEKTIRDAEAAATAMAGGVTPTTVVNPTTVVAFDPTETPQAPTQPTTVSAYCGQARDLGPWAPSNGVGETFEVTATKNDSTGIVLGLWFPAGNTPWGQKEITTFVEPGLSIEVQAGAGRGFDYPVGCSATEVDSQMAAHIVQRKLDTTYNGYVDVDELIRLGLVVVRFDRRGQ